MRIGGYNSRMNTSFFPFARRLAALVVFSLASSTLLVTRAENRTVNMDTSFGTIVIELYSDKAPVTVQNFVDYVEAGFYDGLIFHRVIPGFVIQGGGFEAGMKKRATKPPIENEAHNGLRNGKYSLSMARTSDPHSATSQFFINLADNRFLDKEGSADGWGYAVFGEVVEGQEIIDRIAEVETTTAGNFQDVPADNVIIESARLN